MKVRAAYKGDHSVQRNNFSLVKAFASKWPTLPPPPKALLAHICAGGPQAASSGKDRLPRQIAEHRMFGLRLASAGMALLILSLFRQGSRSCAMLKYSCRMHVELHIWQGDAASLEASGCRAR